MVVTREQLERSIVQLRTEVRDPKAGIYGPGSVSWLVDRELITFLGGGRAALLQLAHPFVAHAVDQHSATRNDPIGRFQRTFKHVYAMAFGDLDHAIAAARRVHAIHARIYGHYDGDRSYHANDPDALLWVHATLVDSAVQAFELVMRPLTGDERDRYLMESRRFAALFGIDMQRFPEDWSAFERYNQRMWHDLVVSQPAREIAAFLMRAPLRPLQPLADNYRILTTGLLPEPIRKQFGFPFGRLQRAAYRASLALIRRSYRALPSRMREVPAYTNALRRLRGGVGPDPIAARLERLLLAP